MRSPSHWAGACALTLLGVPTLANAQEAAASVTTTTTAATEPAAPEEPAPAAEPAPVAATTTTTTTAPATQPTTTTTTTTVEPTPEEAPKEDDHLGVVGHLGIGLLGSTTAMTLNPDFSTNTILLPTIGARYWLSERLGLQAGVGLMHQSGDNNQSNQQAGFDTPTSWAFSLHVGAPIALYHDKHYKFLVQPEANFVGVTGRTNDDQNVPGDQGVSTGGWGLDLGARAGAEVHFGFIGIPMLSLQGSVGLAYRLRQAKLQHVENGQLIEQTKTEHSFGTAHYNDPWDLFTSSIAALYYF